MRCTVFTYESCSVEAEYHVQVQEGHIVDNIVEGTLGKGAIDITEGYKTVFRHTTGEGDGMSLSDTYVESPVRNLLHHNIHRTD